MLEMSEEEISVLSAPAVDASAVDIGPKSVHMKQQRHKLLPNKTYNSSLGTLCIVKMDRVQGRLRWGGGKGGSCPSCPFQGLNYFSAKVFIICPQ